MSILKRGAPDTYTSVRVLALVCDCLSTEALRATMCQVPHTLEATLAAMLATLDVASATPGILLLHSFGGRPVSYLTARSNSSLTARWGRQAQWIQASHRGRR